MDIAIIGAGVAGLSAAQHLSSLGPKALRISCFDKGRGPGGRLSGRRAAGGAIDHGAQYFTVHDKGFQNQVWEWQAAGLVDLYPGIARQHASGEILMESDQPPRWCGSPRMNSPIHHLASQFQVQWSCRIQHCQRIASSWWLESDDGHRYGPYDALIVAIPAPQAVDLLGPVPQAADLAASCRQARLAPCWAAMAWFAPQQWANPLTLPWTAAHLDHDPVLSWLAWEQTKPGRQGPPRLLMHAQVAWSREHLEASPGWVADRLFAAASRYLPQSALPSELQAHRWRFARVEQAKGAGPVFDAAAMLGLAGDWCVDARIEAAWISGRDCVQALLAALPAQPTQI
ncbi:MAG: NAD/FAD-dependent oxidoreductase [Planctomycetota bacterium]|nr:MAG: NAD/FAD-dependent oxidoreductase [Planctomycetota bacterium]